MPTTVQEAEIIADIVEDVLVDAIFHYDDMGLTSREVEDEAENWSAEIFSKLLPVALLTDNYSVRQSIFMIHKQYDEGWKIPEDWMEELHNRWQLAEDTELEAHEYIGCSKKEFERWVEVSS